MRYWPRPWGVFLTHPSLDVPDFVKPYHYVTSMHAIKEFFSKPAIDPEDVDELYGIIMSRLPGNIEEYVFDQGSSDAETAVWRHPQAAVVPMREEDAWSTVSISGAGPWQTVKIDYYRGGGQGNVAGWHDLHVIDYHPEEEVIESFDRCTVLEWDGRTQDNTCRWPASAAFWAEIVKMLREKLPVQSESAST